MGIVSEYVRSLLAKQVKEHGIVVWYDPDKHYQGFVKELTIPDTVVSPYQGSFFALRHEIEPLIARAHLPRLIVYVPLSQDVTHNALAEVEAAGVVLRPGSSLFRVTRDFPWLRRTH